MCSVAMKEVFRLGPETVCFKLESDTAETGNTATANAREVKLESTKRQQQQFKNDRTHDDHDVHTASEDIKLHVQMDEELARLAEVLRLPQDVLRLTDGSRTRQSHEQADPTGLSGAGVCLMCRIGLERGTLFGPFRASLRSVGSSENNNKRKKSISRNDAASPEQSISAELSCDIEVMVSGALSVLSLEDEAGAWLKCIRLRSETDEQNSTTLRESKKRQQDDSTAPENVTGCGTSTNASYPGANCLILYQEGEVCLTLTADVAPNEPLVAEFRVAFSDAPIKLETQPADVDVAYTQDLVDESHPSNGEDTDLKMQDAVNIKSSPASSPRAPRSPECVLRVTGDTAALAAVSMATAAPATGPVSSAGPVTVSTASKIEPLPPPSVGVAEKPAAFRCTNCGISFQNHRNLAAHTAYYCTQRFQKAHTPQDSIVAATSTSSTTTSDSPSPIVASSPNTRRQNGASEKSDCAIKNSVTAVSSVSPPLSTEMIVSCPESPALAHTAIGGNSQKRSLSPDSSGADERPVSKSPRLSTGSAGCAERVFACPHCTYTTDRKGSLTRHLRVHVLSPEDAVAPPIATPAAARYCADCDIQFSSFKTYTVHKQFYCNTRAVQKQQQQQQQQHQQQQQTSAVGVGSVPSPGLSASTSPAGVPTGLPSAPVTVGSGGPVLPQALCASASSGSKTPVGALPSASAMSAVNVLGAGAPMVGASQLANQPLFAAISTNPLVLVPCAFVPGSGLVPVQAGTTECAPILSPGGASGGTLSPRPASARDAEEIASESILPDRATTTTPRDSDQESVATATSSSADLKDALGGVASRKGGEVASATAPLDLSTTPKKENSRDDTNTLGSKRGTPVSQDIDLAADLSNSSANLKQALIRCSECGISFHKPESLAAHRKHYCVGRPHVKARNRKCSEVVPEEVARPSARECGTAPVLQTAQAVTQQQAVVLSSGQRSPSPQTASSGEGRLSASSTPATTATPCAPGTPQTQGQPSSILTSAPATAPQPVFQFYCIACGIKFTSLNNLQAHQTYYCPKRELLQANSVRVGVLSRPVAELECPRCRLAFPGEEPLRSHACSARKCPYCDVYCASHSAAQRHLATHAGIKAFKCTLCGYKGHTLRGMRTHVRVHVDKGALVHEEKFIVCVGENGEPIPPPPSGANIVHFLAAKSPALDSSGDSTMKGERSERSGSISKVEREDQASRDAREDAVAAATAAVSASATLVNALTLGPVASITGPVVGLGSSTSSGSSRPSSAESREPAGGGSSRTAENREARQGGPGSPSPRDSVRTEVANKEALSSSAGCQPVSQSSGPDSPAKPEMHHWCNFCGYSSSYKGNVVRHIKLIHRDVLANGLAPGQMGSVAGQPASVSSLPSAVLATNFSGLPAQAALAAAAAAQLSAAQLSAMNELLSLRNNNELVKRLRSTDSDDENASASNGDSGLKESTSRVDSPVVTLEASASCIRAREKTSPVIDSGEAGNSDRRCDECDISFNYASSYLAHKKFYCKAASSDNVDSPSGDASRSETPVAQGPSAPCQTASV
ncbi:uncharacterized protein LOC111253690 isoform X2 [Varroa destructor]|uniref:Zinc finger protein ush n=1 Tax=Varroa destructor TaxID=109461 RepID=A0A7M7KN20_VARDE|nr:uncharacterized protein LOC111253690 isoform X2 [Varroa destructor]